MQTSIRIKSISGPLSASVCVPGSKSLTNRALMLSALAGGTTRLNNALYCDDSLYFVESLRRLGYNVQLDPEPDQLRSSPSRKMDNPGQSIPSITVTGQDGRIPAKQAELFVGNAGTAARFLTAMLTLGHGLYTLDGDARMRQRPMRDLLAALEQLGAVITQAYSMDQSFISGLPCSNLPVSVHARGLSGGQAVISGDVSSQFLSALLMAAAYARYPVELQVENGLNSKPFVDMTLAVMADFGVMVEREGYDRYFISPQHYISPGTYLIECDASAASYFFAAAAICGGSVQVEGIARPSKQGDLAFLDILVQMGVRVTDEPDGIRVTAPRVEPGQASLRGVTVAMGDISDTAQTLAVIAPFASTPTTIHGISSTRLKETDRVAAMCVELTRLGVQVEEYPDGLTIHPCQDFRPAEIHTYHDHRMAMAFSLIGLQVAGLTILDPGCVSKTFPGFFDVLGGMQM